ncbi:hypothetical protein DP20_3034 [Shigella flexneri]|nr:hypothetical protein DP20_3034 [Shigella flexneri]
MLIPPLSPAIGGVVMTGPPFPTGLLPVDTKLMIFAPLIPD